MEVYKVVPLSIYNKVFHVKSEKETAIVSEIPSEPKLTIKSSTPIVKPGSNVKNTKSNVIWKTFDELYPKK